MTIGCDVAVVGAGPAGVGAAVEAARTGLHVILLDRAAAAGGQVYRAPDVAPRHADADLRRGERLRRLLAASSVEFRPLRSVWSVEPGFRLHAVGPDGPETIEAARLVAATGALERIVPFPGWTLPGVIGLAAATVLLKASAMSPGRRVVVAGCGPLLPAVAAKLAAAGVDVAAVADLAARTEWLAALPSLGRRPALLAQGLGWTAALARRRVPVLFRHAVLEAQGDGAVRRVRIGSVDADGRPDGRSERWVDCDALVVGHGLSPSSDIPLLLQAAHGFDAQSHGWVPQLDPAGRTSIPGLYAAGDGAGIAGALPAALAGRIAGRAAAADCGRPVRSIAGLQRAHRRSRGFAGAISRLIRVRPGLLDAMTAETVVCRCEDVTRAEIEAAITAGARELNQLKSFTRCGMGPCQGRSCGEAAAELMAQHVGSRNSVGRWTMRPPLQPVPVAALVPRTGFEPVLQP